MAAFPRATAFAVALTLLAGACVGGGEPRSPDVARGVLRTPGDALTIADLEGNAAGDRWQGSVQIAFTNTGDAPLTRIWLRTWANGVGGCARLAVDVTVTGGGAAGRSQRDCTALEVVLDTPAAPAERGTIDLDLSISVPRRNDRFGVHEGLANMGGALPVLAVFDDHGWHLDPYADIGESFYSVSGRYRVRLDVPAGVDTPATGTEVAREVHGDRIARTFAASRVRDFMWSAGQLVERSATVSGARIRVWSRPGSPSSSVTARALADARTALDAFDAAFGDYPYPELDVVLAGFTSFGGMEYPQLVLTTPRRDTIAHEIAHQWWWVVVGSDEYAEPWLDESLASWSQELPWRPWTGCDHWQWPSPAARITNDMGYWREHPKEYVTIYLGGGCMLAALADAFGVSSFTRILRGYASDHAFGVARTRDFVGAVERAAAREIPGFDLAAFWRTWRVGET